MTAPAGTDGGGSPARVPRGHGDRPGSGERLEGPRPVNGPKARTRRATRARPQAGAGTRSVREVLARVPYFQSLSPAEIRALGRRGATRTVAQGDHVFTEGEPCHGLFVIIEGTVDVRQTSEAGREQSLHAEGSAATLGEVPLFDGGGYLASAVAVAPTRLLVLPRGALLALCRRRPAVALAFLETLARRVRRVATLAADLAFREVTERVARHLEVTARAEGRRGGGDHLRARAHAGAARHATWDRPGARRPGTRAAPAERRHRAARPPRHDPGPGPAGHPRSGSTRRRTARLTGLGRGGAGRGL